MESAPNQLYVTLGIANPYVLTPDISHLVSGRNALDPEDMGKT